MLRILWQEQGLKARQPTLIHPCRPSLQITPRDGHLRMHTLLRPSAPELLLVLPMSYRLLAAAVSCEKLRLLCFASWPELACRFRKGSSRLRGGGLTSHARLLLHPSYSKFGSDHAWPKDYNANVGMKSAFLSERQDGLMVKLQHCLHLATSDADYADFACNITAASKKAEASTRKNAQDV